MKRRGDEKARDEETRGWGEDGGGYRTVGGGRGRTDEGARPDVRGGAGGGTDERTRGRGMRGRGDEGTTGDERTRKGTRLILTIIYIIYLFKITLGSPRHRLPFTFFHRRRRGFQSCEHARAVFELKNSRTLCT